MNLSNIDLFWLFASIVVLISLVINIAQWLIGLIHKNHIKKLEFRNYALNETKKHLSTKLQDIKKLNHVKTTYNHPRIKK